MKAMWLVYAGAVLAVSLVAFGLWGIAAAVMMLLFWWLWRQPEVTLRLLAVATLLVLLVGLVLGPAVPLAREAALRNQCLGHLKKQWLALYNYDYSNGHLPPRTFRPNRHRAPS